MSSLNILVSKVLKAKYVPKIDLLPCKAQSFDSWLWKCIVSTKKSVLGQVLGRLWNGQPIPNSQPNWYGFSRSGGTSDPLNIFFVAELVDKDRQWLRACLVSVFKHSFLCLNTENGGPGLNFFCLVTVFTFCIQIQLLFNWYSIHLKWEQLFVVFTWTQPEFSYYSKDRWQFWKYYHLHVTANSRKNISRWLSFYTQAEIFCSLSRWISQLKPLSMNLSN